MKKTMSLVFIAVLVLIALVLLEPVTMAQLNPYTIKVPFSFNVGDRTFAAGVYRVSRIGQAVVELRGVDNSYHGTVVTNFIYRDKRDLNAKLVFHQYGRRYFLSQVWFVELNTGAELPQSITEVEYAKQLEKAETALMSGQ